MAGPVYQRGGKEVGGAGCRCQGGEQVAQGVRPHLQASPSIRASFRRAAGARTRLRSSASSRPAKPRRARTGVPTAPILLPPVILSIGDLLLHITIIPAGPPRPDADLSALIEP